jgi:hypothetical protein
MWSPYRLGQIDQADSIAVGSTRESQWEMGRAGGACPRGVKFNINGAPIGVIADLHFAEIILATFIGLEPPTARLKHELLGEPG